MGMDATCDIAYGFVVDEDDLPWRTDEYEYDIDRWWQHLKGYEAPFELFDAKGNWLPEMKEDQAKRNEYYRHRNEWQQQNPVPFGEVIGSQGESEAVITSTNIGDMRFDWDNGIEEVNPKSFKINDEQAKSIELIRDLLTELDIPIKRGPGWFALCDYA